jgi:hypothetical protein
MIWIGTFGHQADHPPSTTPPTVMYTMNIVGVLETKEDTYILTERTPHRGNRWVIEMKNLIK